MHPVKTDSTASLQWVSTEFTGCSPCQSCATHWREEAGLGGITVWKQWPDLLQINHRYCNDRWLDGEKCLFSPFAIYLLLQIKCIRSKFTCWNSNAEAIRRWDFGSWLSHESKALISGISALLKESPRNIPHPSYCVKTQHEHGHLWLRKQTVSRHQVYQCLNFGLPRFQICKK
jgi:hypothetical protein